MVETLLKEKPKDTRMQELLREFLYIVCGKVSDLSSGRLGLRPITRLTLSPEFTVMKTFTCIQSSTTFLSGSQWRLQITSSDFTAIGEPTTDMVL